MEGGAGRFTPGWKAEDQALTSSPLRYWTWGLAVFAAIWAVAVTFLLPEPLDAARQHWPLAVLGFFGAVIGNATAIGGGLVFVPVLLLIYELPAVEGLYLALAAQSLGMTSGAVAWVRSIGVPRRAFLVCLPAMLVGGALSAFVILPSPLLVKGLFGPVSILIGLLILYLVDRHTDLEEMPPGAERSLFIIAVLGGLLTGWVAIGVGEVVAAYLMLVCRMRPERAIGLGVVLLAGISIFLTVVHTSAGRVPWEMAAFLGFGCVFGARLGPFLCQWVSVRWLKLIFATIAIVDGALFVWQSMRS